MTLTRLSPAGASVQIWRDYLRVSKDRSGRERSPKDQHKDHEKDAAGAGAALHPDPYGDVGSASAFAKKEREDFERLLDDLRADRFGAQVLALWEGSRGSRKVGEWVTLLDLLTERKVLVWIHTHNRMYDPTNPHDRHTLIDEANDSELETGKTSLRVKRDLGILAEEGHPHGQLRFGYRRLYDEKTRALLNDEPDPAERVVIEDLFTQFYEDGRKIRAIERDFAQRGITRRDGGVFSAAHLRIMLKMPGYAGFRVHNPDGSKEPFLSSQDPRLYPAKWDAIIEPKVFFEVQRILADPGRKTSKPGRGKHMFTMFTVCDPCGGPLSVRTYRREVYHCNTKGCVMIGKKAFEDYVEECLLSYLERPEVLSRLRRGNEAAAGNIARLESQLVDARGELAALKANVAEGKLSMAWAVDVAPTIEARIGGLEAQLNDAQVPSVLRGFVGGSARARWAEAPMSRKREVAALVLSPEWAGQVRLRKSNGGAGRRSTPPVDRVVFRLPEEA